MREYVDFAKITERDPVCGMTVDPSAAKGQVEHTGKTYYFCSPHCVTKFQQDPEQYLQKAAPASNSDLVTLGMSKPAQPSAARVKDPVCGMDVDPTTARYHLEHAGKTYYFCCGGCLEKFRADPDRDLSPKTSPALIRQRFPIRRRTQNPLRRSGLPHPRLGAQNHPPVFRQGGARPVAQVNLMRIQTWKGYLHWTALAVLSKKLLTVLSPSACFRQA